MPDEWREVSADRPFEMPSNPSEFLARRIDRSLWEQPTHYNGLRDVNADSLLTGTCLKTRGNKLSFWECHDHVNDVQEVALAIVSNYQSLDPVHLFLFERRVFASILLEQTQGETPVVDLRARHHNAKNLNLEDICTLSQEIASKVRSNQCCYSFTESEVAGILANAVTTGRLGIDRLKPGVKGKVDEFLQKMKAGGTSIN